MLQFTRIRLVLTALSCYAAVASSEPVSLSGDYAWRLPPGFPQPVVPADNPMSDAKVALGCRLFFESRLSTTGTYSCASCHDPKLAFTDGRARAIGATGSMLSRSAMSLANVAYNPAFTWANDRITTLENQMEQPLFSDHPVEMGLRRSDPALPAWCSADASYAGAFRAAFPDEPAPWSLRNMVKAIAAFTRTLISGRSAFDRYIYDDDRNALSAAAKQGMALFFSDRAGCAACHFGVNFSGPIVHRAAPLQSAIFANNGSHGADEKANADPGLLTVSATAGDRGRFRVPTLRNIALTAPYMHDGSIATLAAVVDHYAFGGQRPDRPNAWVDPAIRPLQLTREEKQSLVEFLRALTDTQFVRRDYSTCRATGREMRLQNGD